MVLWLPGCLGKQAEVVQSGDEAKGVEVVRVLASVEAACHAPVLHVPDVLLDLHPLAAQDVVERAPQGGDGAVAPPLDAHHNLDCGHLLPLLLRSIITAIQAHLAPLGS